VRSLRCAELAEWLADGRACSILDVRTAGEFHSHRIPGATLIPLHELEARVDEALALPGPLVVHCEHGIRSLDASVYLVWQGRRDVYNVVEGIAAWRGPIEGASVGR
jgi:rhodanese-related sulfurtransferase